MRYLYILKIKPLSVESFANIFSHSSGCHCFSDDFLCCERLLGIFLVVQWLRLGTFTAVGAGLSPGLGRSRGREHGNPLMYSFQESLKDRAASWATIHRVVKNWP